MASSSVHHTFRLICKLSCELVVHCIPRVAFARSLCQQLVVGKDKRCQHMPLGTSWQELSAISPQAWRCGEVARSLSKRQMGAKGAHILDTLVASKPARTTLAASETRNKATAMNH